jgi:FkbM family methyltransferase
MKQCSPMSWYSSKITETAIPTLSGVLRAVPDRLPGKARLGRMLLRPFLYEKPAVLKDRAGYTYVLPSYAEPISEHIFTFGAYELDTQHVILKFLSQMGTLVDVGANIGALAIPIAKARPKVSIICIEADPNIHQFLQDNVSRNSCDRVRVFSCVAGATDGQLVAFYRAPDDKFGMGSLGPQFDSFPIMVKQRTLDAMLTGIGMNRIDVIKIDVEGAEVSVLRGAQQLLASERPPTIVFEFVDWAEARIAGQLPGDAQTLLLIGGYRLFQVERGGQIGKELREPMRCGSAMLLALPPHLPVPRQ